MQSGRASTFLQSGRAGATLGGMKYAILRTQKLKATGAVWRSLKHAFREQPTPNADPAKAAQNAHLGATSAAEAMQRVRDRLPEKRRKDAVLAIEYLITASPEVMQAKDGRAQTAYFDDALKWLRERHGAANVVYAGIHRDESTPHMYAYVVPLDEATGRLNARRWLGGSKALSEMQTDFAATVGHATAWSAASRAAGPGMSGCAAITAWSTRHTTRRRSWGCWTRPVWQSANPPKRPRRR